MLGLVHGDLSSEDVLPELLHAINRQEMVDTIQYGLVPVAYGLLNPSDPDYPAVESSIVRYEYDPRKAIQMIEELGYSRLGDGLFHDAAGQSLGVQVVSSSTDLYIRTALASADYWKRVGIDSEPYTVPDARERDLDFRANYPGFEVVSSGSGIDGLKKFPHIRVFANAATARAVQDGLEHRPDWQIFETGARFIFRDLLVESFAVPHDATIPSTKSGLQAPARVPSVGTLYHPVPVMFVPATPSGISVTFGSALKTEKGVVTPHFVVPAGSTWSKARIVCRLPAGHGKVTGVI